MAQRLRNGSVFCDNDCLTVPKALGNGNRNRSLSDPVHSLFNKSAISTENHEQATPEINGYLLENFAVQDQVATLLYSKVFKAKRHSDSKMFFLKCTAQCFDGTENDLHKSDVLIREMIAFNKFRHKCLLKGEACWFEIYNMKSISDTPSLDQPFNLYDLPPENNVHCSTSSINSNNNSTNFNSNIKSSNNDNNDNVAFYDVQAKSFLSAIFEDGDKRASNRSTSTIVEYPENSYTTEESQRDYGSYDEQQEKIVVVFSLLEYIPLTLEDVLNDKGFQLTEDDKWRIGFHLCTFLYYYHRHNHLHLQLTPDQILIDVDEITSTLTPKLMDYGVNLSVSSSNPPLYHNLLDGRRPPELSPNGAATATVDSSADIFGLGLLFVQLFAHPATYDFHSIYGQLIRGRTECLSQIVLPSDVVFLLEQMLTEAPGARPEPSEILDYAVPFVDVDFPLDPEVVKPLIDDRQHSDMLIQVVETILYVELKVAEANVLYKQWLNKIPQALWEAILQNRSKIDSEHFLHDQCNGRRIDFEYILDKIDDRAIDKFGLHLNDGDLLKVVVYLLHKRYRLDEADENPDITGLFEKLCKILL